MEKPKVSFNKLFNLKPAAQPGLHAPATKLSSEYISDIVTDRVSLLNKSHYWSKAKLEKYQLKKLRVLLTNANRNVPYYRKLFN